MPELKFPEFHGRRVHARSAKRRRHLRRAPHSATSCCTIPSTATAPSKSFIAAGAADDRNVISIKQTLYRTSADSPIFRALTEAAQTKDVTVVVELMARFDEASNIRWARELEDAGVQVFHGIFGLKTHCKLALLVRRDPDGVIRRYAHLGTGNYNPVTARFYTDISLLTARPELTDAVQRVFRYLTAELGSRHRRLPPAARRAPHARTPTSSPSSPAKPTTPAPARPAHIIAKMNALLDGPTIEALYAASQAGVEIDLIVRGMCALRPGVHGLSEHIRVRSIVGRFLEHSRIFWFANGGEPTEVFCGSADWMPRNLYERCEVVFPVVDPALKRRLRDEILDAYLRDNLKARLLQPDGTYHRAPKSVPALSAQQYLMELSRTPDKQPHPRQNCRPSKAPPQKKRKASCPRNNPASSCASHYIASAPNC